MDEYREDYTFDRKFEGNILIVEQGVVKQLLFRDLEKINYLEAI